MYEGEIMAFLADWRWSTLKVSHPLSYNTFVRLQ